VESSNEIFFLQALKKVWDELALREEGDDAIRLVISAAADIAESSNDCAGDTLVHAQLSSADSAAAAARDILSLTAVYIAAKEIAIKEEKRRAVEEEHSLRQMHRLLLKQNMELRERTMVDELTGLFNRRYFERSLSYDIERFRRYGRPFGVVLFDVDHFKAINDNFGHSVGDTALKHLAESAKETIRSADMAARYGGEEFVLILPETGKSGAAVLAERLRKRVESASIMTANGEVKMTISLGVLAVEGEFSGDAEDVMRFVDNALYAAKDAGRNCFITA
jgi:diguanylate cyclase (GGDEF)-like protein